MERPGPDATDTSDDSIFTYMVECYLPGMTPGELTSFARRAKESAGGLAAKGSAVRYLCTTFVPQDEMSFSLFEGPSARSLAHAIELAGITYERIVEAVQVSTEDVTGEGEE
jgi:hypothetical protein